MATPVQTLLSQIGLSSSYTQFCDCSSSKFCSPSTPTLIPPADEYSICQYWAATLTLGYLPNPPGAWIEGATDSGATDAQEAATAIRAIPGGAALAGVVSAIGSLFGAAHARAQAAQANAIVAGIPYANALIQQIASYLSSKAITAPEAVQAYQQLQAQFTSLMKQGTSYKTGDALWTCDIANQLLIAQLTNALEGSEVTPVDTVMTDPLSSSVLVGTSSTVVAAAPSATVAPVATATATGFSIPIWAILLLVGIVLLAVL